MRRLSVMLLAIVVSFAARAETVLRTDHYRVRVVTVAEGFQHPWGMAFLPGGRMLVTERPGWLRIVGPDGRFGPPVAGMPKIGAVGQGGLLDVALDPFYASTHLIYFTFAEPGPGGVGTAVARGRLDVAGNRVTGVQVLFSQKPKSNSGRHFGSRIVFGADGRLFITTGDRGESQRNQNFAINRGQVIRLERDGRIPADNPFAKNPGGRAGYRPEAWSLGHRNPQGAARHPLTGKLWLHEHGAQGGDEINIPAAGKNYGWPIIAYGEHYGGGKIGEGTHKPGLEQPIYYWDPSIAPSGMAFYTGDKFPKWQGNLLVGALKFRLLVRLELDGERVVAEERMLEDLGDRIRDVRQGPDGFVYLLTDDDPGRVLRLEPAN